MNLKPLAAVVLVWACCLAKSITTEPCAAAEPAWKAGVASIVITPEGPYWMAGYASRKGPSEGTLRDLYAKALAIEDANGSRMVIVTMDLLVVTRELAQSVGRRVEKHHHLPRSRLLLNCSHTHCGPEIRLYREEVHNIPGMYAKKMHEYVKTLEDKLVGIIGEAIANRRPAELAISQATAEFAVNRRNNREQDVPALRKKGKLKGPVDHAVPVMQVSDAKGQKIAILLGYACHNTVLSFYQTCGDYAGFAQQYIEEQCPGVQAMFVMGAGGDQNPLPRRGVEYVRQHGKSLAAAVQRARSAPQRPVHGPLRVASADAHLEFQPHPDRATLEEQKQSPNPYRRWKANYILRELDAGREIPRRYDLPIQVASFGDDLLLIAIGGETVVDYSLRIKREYGRPNGPLLWVAGYSNDVFGYLPSLRVLKEGGYEGGGHMVYTKFPGPFSETVEQRVFDTIEQLVGKKR